MSVWHSGRGQPSPTDKMCDRQTWVMYLVWSMTAWWSVSTAQPKAGRSSLVDIAWTAPSSAVAGEGGDQGGGGDQGKHIPSSLHGPTQRFHRPAGTKVARERLALPNSNVKLVAP